LFGFVQWDNPLTLALEVLISLALLVALVLIATKVNAGADAAHRRSGSSLPPAHDPSDGELPVNPNRDTVPGQDQQAR
jgi:hypothetical protein